MVGYTLTTLDEPSMWHLAGIINVRLDSGQRKFLAAAALWGLDKDEYAEVIAWVEGSA